MAAAMVARRFAIPRRENRSSENYGTPNWLIMSPRIVSLWFPHLMTDWMQRRQPELKEVSFALAAHEQNRRVIKAVNGLAYVNDVRNNMVVADARAVLPELQVFDFDEEQPRKLLLALSE